jgi:hypothetical protein
LCFFFLQKKEVLFLKKKNQKDFYSNAVATLMRCVMY